MNLEIEQENLDETFKKGIGLFPEEQEIISNAGLYYDTDIEEHFEYFNFDENTKKIIHDEYNQLLQVMNDPILLDSIEQFWFANKAGTELERSLIIHLFKQLPPEFPVGEIYVVFDDSYISFQIVFMPNQVFPYLTSIMLLQNETTHNKQFIQPLINRFSLQKIYDNLLSMKK